MCTLLRSSRQVKTHNCPIYNDWQSDSHIDSVLNNYVNGTGNSTSVGTGTGIGNGNGTGTGTAQEAVMVQVAAPIRVQTQ